MEVTLDIKDKTKVPFLMELLGSLDYIRVKKVEKQKQTGSWMLADLAEAFEDVKLHRQGKIKLKSLKEALDEF